MGAGDTEMRQSHFSGAISSAQRGARTGWEGPPWPTVGRRPDCLGEPPAQASRPWAALVGLPITRYIYM